MRNGSIVFTSSSQNGVFELSSGENLQIMYSNCGHSLDFEYAHISRHEDGIALLKPSSLFEG